MSISAQNILNAAAARIGPIVDGLAKFWVGSDTDTVYNGSADIPSLANIARQSLAQIDSITAGAIQSAVDANTQAQAAAVTAVLAADGSGLVKIYATKAAATADVANLAAGAWVEVSADESITGSPRTRYQVQSGALVLMVNLDQLRVDLDSTTGATRVGLAEGGTVQDFTSTDEGKGVDKIGNSIKRVALLTDLQALTNLSYGKTTTVLTQGRTAIGDCGGGEFFFITGNQSTKVSADPQMGIWVPPNSDLTGASGAWKRNVSGWVNVLSYGAIGDGVNDDTTAILASVASGLMLFVPYGTFIIKQPITLDQGGLTGQGWSESGQFSKLLFMGLTSATEGAILTRQTTSKNLFVRLKNIYIAAASWDPVTGCSGYGLDFEAPVIVENVIVDSFKKSGVFLHQNASKLGPYQSYFKNVRSVYNGNHGFFVGSGANVVSFVNCEGKWNGATAYATAPTVAGVYDGFFIADLSDGLYPAYVPQGLSIIGGDCSYNSRYGWNIDSLSTSVLSPGYAEGNLVNQARTGILEDVQVMFGPIAGLTAGYVNDTTYKAYFYRNLVTIGGKRVAPVDYYGFIANPALEDESGGTVQNAPSNNIFMSRDNAGANLAYFFQNASPDGLAANLAAETILSLAGFGNYSLGFGGGSRHLKITPNIVRLPDIYYQATETGWNASAVSRGFGSAIPTTGTYTLGSIVYNSSPAANGNVGWVCVAGGTPGTWKSFGAISA